MKNLIIISMIMIAIFLFTGCSKDMGSTDEQSSGLLSGITGIMSTLDQQYQAGWNSFARADYANAMKVFQSLLLNQPSPKMLSASETAIGWVYMKQGEISKALPLFEKHQNTLADAKIGAAMCFLSDKDSKNIPKGVTYLEGAGFSSLDYTYQSPAGLNLSSAEIRAVLALYYAQLGDKVRAGYQIRKANTLEPQNVHDLSELLKNIYLIEVNSITGN